MGRNIELKLKTLELETARGACQGLGAQYAGRFTQTDTYFAVPPPGRLKLRESSDQPAELIAYQRLDAASPRESDYVRSPCPDSRQLIVGLTLVLGVRGVVSKTRELWLWENVRIHLDEVDRLGSFIEFEAVLGEGQSAEEGVRQVQRLREALEWRPDQIVSVSYVDLLF